LQTYFRKCIGLSHDPRRVTMPEYRSQYFRVRIVTFEKKALIDTETGLDFMKRMLGILRTHWPTQNQRAQHYICQVWKEDKPH